MAFFRGDFFSPSLEMNTSVNVIIPDGAVNSETNVLYLLHGLSDNCTGWARLTSIERYANQHRIAVIMPEVQRSYYCDMVYGLSYFQYIVKDLREFAHGMFNLPIKREKSFIAGLSMGGYGAMKAGLSHPEYYAACAGFSAVCDIENCMQNEMPAVRIPQLTGILGNALMVQPENNLYRLAEKCSRSDVKPRIFMTCGTKDSLYQQNLSLKSHYEALKLDCKYEEWYGDHTWDFWDKSIQMALEFFFGKPLFGTPTPLSDDSQ